MLPDRVSNLGPLTYESGALPIALRGPASCVGLSFPDICGQGTMTNKGAKRNVPHLLQAQQAPVWLWSISETSQSRKFHGIFTKSTVSKRVCWSFRVIWGSVLADFRQLKVGGEGKKEERYGIDKKSEPK